MCKGIPRHADADTHISRVCRCDLCSHGDIHLASQLFSPYRRHAAGPGQPKGQPSARTLYVRFLYRRVPFGHLGQEKLNSRPLFAAITTLISALLVFTAFSLTGDAQYAVLIVMGVLITTFAPTVWFVVQEVVHPGLRGMSYAFAVLCMNLLGGSLGPIVVGAISDASNLQTTMLTLPIFLVVSAGLFFAASFFYVRDFNKVEKVTLEVEA